MWESDANTLIFEPGGGRDSVFLNIELRQLDCVSRMTQKLDQVSKKMHTGIATFIQPVKKLHRRPEEALMKLTSPGYRQISLELADVTEALEASETTGRRRRRQKEEVLKISGIGRPHSKRSATQLVCRNIRR